MSSFVITKRYNDLYKFEFTSRRGKTIFSSLGFELKFECELAIENFKNNTANCIFEKHKAAGGKHYFKIFLISEAFATSRKYSTELRLEKGIEEIKKFALIAEIIDFSDQKFIFEEPKIND